MMRRAVAVLMLMCVASEATAYARNSFSVEPGYRHDDYKWNIAAPGGVPDVLSELTWENMHIAQVRTNAVLEHDSGPRVQGSVAYGHIVAGDNRDSDYLGNDRTFEFSRSDNDGGGGTVREASIAVGWVLGEEGDLRADGGGTSYFVPMLGYAWREIDLHITGGHQSIPDYGDFPGLDSRYKARWRGPWLGIEYVDRVPEDLYGFLRLEYHMPQYDAVANWNLRDDFQHPKSYAHSSSEGKGYVLSLGFQTPPRRGEFSWRLAFDFQWWRAEDGEDRTYFTNGGVGRTRLNEVDWDSWSIHYGIQYDF